MTPDLALTPTSDCAGARALFPRGLVQPPGLRFSADALLLASFAGASIPPHSREHVLDLGTGCGVVGLALLLQRPGLSVIGVDLQEECVASAMANGRALGLDDHFAAVRADLRQVRDCPELRPGSFDLATANPPYRIPGTGRPAAGKSRNLARFETAAELGDFCRAAAWSLKNRGGFHLVFLAERLPELLAALADSRLEPKQVLPVHSRASEPARLVLVRALKNGGPGLRLDPPLVLYEGIGEATRLTDAALAFCPFLACNPRGGSSPADDSEPGEQ